jgi:hypothetical protein
MNPAGESNGGNEDEHVEARAKHQTLKAKSFHERGVFPVERQELGTPHLLSAFLWRWNRHKVARLRSKIAPIDKPELWVRCADKFGHKDVLTPRA